MGFTGKSTYDGGGTLPEIVEDVSDLVSIVSPHETPLLDLLGDAMREAQSTVHEWLEDELIPSHDVVGDCEPGTEGTEVAVLAPQRFRAGDQVSSGVETMLVTAVDHAQKLITVVRAYGGSDAVELTEGAELRILGNAALEGGAADAARYTVRKRQQNFTQIFTATVEVSGSEMAVRQHGVADELSYQKQQRLRELLRSLENTVINGRASQSAPLGSSTERRSMDGLLARLRTNRFQGGQGEFADEGLSEAMLNLALRRIWEHSASPIDTILVGAPEKRLINGFMTASRRFGGDDEVYRDRVSLYESDFGLCRVVLSRHVPAKTVLLLDSTRLQVLPLRGRSFHYRELPATGDSRIGQLLGEYTLELRSESAHGVLLLA
jgi:hypothetical protein